MSVTKANIFIDGREFVNFRTGISRVLEGLLICMESSDLIETVRLGLFDDVTLPINLQKCSKIKKEKLSHLRIKSEMNIISKIQNDCDLFISPYPKLPIGPAPCNPSSTVIGIF